MTKRKNKPRRHLRKGNPTRKFGGKTYKLHISSSHGMTKFTADSLQKSLKRRGYHTRKIKSGRDYYIYIRKR